MNPAHYLIYLLMIMLCATVATVAEPNPEAEQGKFADHSGDEPKLLEGEFFTAAGLTVKPLNRWDQQLVAREDWPEVAPPTTFNQSFESPAAVWRIDGGFLASFDGGEFGGALFFSRRGAKRWTKIIDGHVTRLERFEGDTYLVAGGLLAGLETTQGRAYLLTRSDTGKWKAKVVFETAVGVPVIIGTTFTEPMFEANPEKLIVMEVDSHWGWEPLFGVSGQGAVHYLGEKLRQRKSEQGGAVQPAAATESKSEGKQEPQPESKPAPR